MSLQPPIYILLPRVILFFIHWLSPSLLTCLHCFLILRHYLPIYNILPLRFFHFSPSPALFPPLSRAECPFPLSSNLPTVSSESLFLPTGLHPPPSVLPLYPVACIASSPFPSRVRRSPLGFLSFRPCALPLQFSPFCRHA